MTRYTASSNALNIVMSDDIHHLNTVRAALYDAGERQLAFALDGVRDAHRLMLIARVAVDNAVEQAITEGCERDDVESVTAIAEAVLDAVGRLAR